MNKISNKKQILPNEILQITYRIMDSSAVETFNAQIVDCHGNEDNIESIGLERSHKPFKDLLSFALASKNMYSFAINNSLRSRLCEAWILRSVSMYHVDFLPRKCPPTENWLRYPLASPISNRNSLFTLTAMLQDGGMLTKRVQRTLSLLDFFISRTYVFSEEEMKELLKIIDCISERRMDPFNNYFQQALNSLSQEQPSYKGALAKHVVECKIQDNSYKNLIALIVVFLALAVYILR